MNELQIVYLSPSELTPYENNTRKHTPADIEGIKRSILADEFNAPIGIWGPNNLIVEGHGRQIAALELGLEKVPCIRLDHLTENQRKEYAIRHNRTAEFSEWDFTTLEEEIAALEIEGLDLSDLNFTFEDETSSPGTQKTPGALFDKFIVPPFSILDTRQGYWQERKAIWREKIGDNGQARGDAKLFSDSLKAEKFAGVQGFADVSILDPVLSEAVCTWFSPGPGSKMFDCFAGDTVFGYVSSYLGNDFTGIELRQEQADFNNAAVAGMQAKYICDDGRNVLDHIGAGTQDMFFSCPPYFDLEVYSDDPKDASNQKDYAAFYEILDSAFSAAVKCLKNNRFAVVVCGDVRDKKTGNYYDFPGDIKATFKRNGCTLYNELILVDAVGTAAIRSQRYMRSRKIAKVHQNVLVFYKGDTRQIQREFPELEVHYEGEDLE